MEAKDHPNYFRYPNDLNDNNEHAFVLESGTQLPTWQLAYHCFGQLNAGRTNVVWIFHALTANSNPKEWWEGLVGEGRLFDPAKYFIVCVNMPGSCYGSSGPLSIDPQLGTPYYHDFPPFTIRDMVRSFEYLRKFLGIEKIYVGVGGSMGGQQLLEWATCDPTLFEHIIPMATNAIHSSWGIAFNTSQRLAIEADESWKSRSEDAGEAGLRAARAFALLSYRSYEGYQHRQPINQNQWEAAASAECTGGAASYQRYQGQKLVARFNAFSYYNLSLGMDSHNLARGRGTLPQVLGRISAKTLVIGIDSDGLFPLQEQQFLAQHIPDAKLVTIHSLFGHDGFLLEYDSITKHIENFLNESKSAIA